MLNVRNLVNSLRTLSTEIGIYQFVVPLNNSGLGGSVLSGASGQEKEIAIEDTGIFFEYGWLTPFPSLPARPTNLVILKQPWVIITELMSSFLTEKDLIDIGITWHLVETKSQSMFLSIGFQKGVCWPWHTDKTITKKHKLIEGDVDFIYKKSRLRLPINELINLDTSILHTVEQLSATRVDLIFDSKETL